MSRLALRPNVGGEEGDARPPARARALARLWRLIFPAEAEWPEPEPPVWPAEWSGAGAPDPSAPAFPWLPASGMCAWWNDAASRETARATGLALAGASPEVAAHVHDKAFAAGVCAREDLLPRALRGRVRAFAPAELADVASFRALLDAELAGWPEALARHATLKPRIGTSGRGRVRVGRADTEDWERALPRLAARGGALLEPWLERVADYSVQLHVATDGAVTLLGSLALEVTAEGVYRGHRGELDHRGRVHCGADLEHELLGPAAELARAAHAEGYTGPCGVDAFAFRDGARVTLRPVVELNARFTAGCVVLGLLRRSRRWIDALLPREPGTRRPFRFALAPGADAPPRSACALHFGEGDAHLEIGPIPAGGAPDGE